MEPIVKDKSTENPSKEHPSVVDIKLSWQLLKKNFKAFVGISLFSFVGMLIVVILVMLLYVIIISSLNDPMIDLELYIASFTTSIILPLEIIIFWGFYGSGYGLAYDIMSSGDGFAESKSGFYYFLKYGWQYIFLAVITNCSIIFIMFPLVDLKTIAGLNRVFYFLFIYLFNFIGNILLFLTFPSLTAQGSLLKAFKENFQLLKKHPKRILLSSSLLYLIFELPILIVFSSYYTGSDMFSTNLGTIPTILVVITSIFGYTFANSMHNLVGTCVYNSYIDMDDEISIKKLF